MNTESLNTAIVDFFEQIEKYYGSKIEIAEIITPSTENFDRKAATWSLFEFYLIRSAYRTSGNKFMLEGNGTYYEIAAENIVNFTKTGRHKYEFVEHYGTTFLRITKLRFLYKY